MVAGLHRRVVQDPRRRQHHHRPLVRQRQAHPRQRPDGRGPPDGQHVRGPRHAAQPAQRPLRHRPVRLQAGGRGAGHPLPPGPHVRRVGRPRAPEQHDHHR